MDKEPVLIKVIQLGTLFLVNEESIYYLLQEKKIYMHPLRKVFHSQCTLCYKQISKAQHYESSPKNKMWLELFQYRFYESI